MTIYNLLTVIIFSLYLLSTDHVSAVVLSTCIFINNQVLEAILTELLLEFFDVDLNGSQTFDSFC